MGDSLDRVDGKLYIRNDSTDSRDPIRRRLWWPVLSTRGWVPCWYEPETYDTSGGSSEHCRQCGQRKDATGHTLTPETLQLGGRDGAYGGRLSNGATYQVYIDPRGQAVKVDETPIPCPKVRAGLETRFERGAWQKYLKSKGWVYA